MFRLANFLELVWKHSGVAPELRARGLDANININLVPKGTGCVQINGGPCLEDLFPLRVAVTDLSSAQLATIGSAPPVFVPAPAAGIGNVVVSAYAMVVPGSIPFNALDTNLGYLGDPGTSALLDTNIVVGRPAVTLSQSTIDAIEFAAGFTPSNRAIVATNQSGDSPSGAIATSALNAGGAGYAALDTFTVNAGSGLAAGVVDTVDGGGGVLTYHLTSGSFGYVPAVGVATVATSGGGDNAFTVDILTITPANGTARVWVVYFPITLP